MNIKNIIANIDKVDLSKKIVRAATALSVGVAIKNIVIDNVPARDNRIANLIVGASVVVGGYVASDYILKELGQHTDARIDELLASFQTPVEEDEPSEIVVLEGPVL